jgi:hypothetical protein
MFGAGDVRSASLAASIRQTRRHAEEQRAHDREPPTAVIELEEERLREEIRSVRRAAERELRAPAVPPLAVAAVAEPRPLAGERYPEGAAARERDALVQELTILKEELIRKSEAARRAETEASRLVEENASLQLERSKLREENQRMHQHMSESDNALHKQIEQLLVQLEKSTNLSEDYQEEVKRMRAEAQQMRHDNVELIRRNDELALVYEKLRLQQTTLSQGEAQYRERMEDIRLLKLEMTRLQREQSLLGKSSTGVDELRQELFQVQRELLRERTRCKALEEEVQTPLNVHRWRRLEGSDPGTFELIQKIQTLQKRLITKTEEVVEKELQIQEQEKQYLELKAVLARQPGPEVAEQLQIYQTTVKEKNRQLKAMASELNMFQSQASEYQFEIERLSKELQEIKKKCVRVRGKGGSRGARRHAPGVVPGRC